MASYATVPAADLESEATLLNSKPKTKTSLLVLGRCEPLEEGPGRYHSPELQFLYGRGRRRRHDERYSCASVGLLHGRRRGLGAEPAVGLHVSGGRGLRQSGVDLAAPQLRSVKAPCS